jgi:hypothetical protein
MASQLEKDVKKDKQKAKRKARKAAKKEMIMTSANTLAPHLKALSAPKKKDSKFVRFMKGALNIATDLVPAVLPFLLGNHKEGIGMARASPQLAAIASAPLAQAACLGNMCGEKDVHVTKRDGRGNVQTIRVTTMDFVKAIAPPASGSWSAGDIVDEIWVNPLDPDFTGTKWALYANGNERYDLRQGVFIFEPVQPATQPGALAMCVFNDPTVDLENTGSTAILRGVSSQAGADEFQYWNAGACMVPIIARDEPLFTEPDNQDIRLSVAGKLTIVAASDVASFTTSPGNLYFLAQTDYSVPSLADAAVAGDAMTLEDTEDATNPTGGLVTFSSTTSSLAFAMGGNAQWEFSATFTYSGASATGSALAGIAPGSYLVYCQGTGTTLTAGGEPSTTDDADQYGVVTSSVRGAIDSTDWVSTMALTVPVGLPPNLPVVVFLDATGASRTNYRIMVIDMNPDAVQTNVPLLKPKQYAGVPRRGTKKVRAARVSFFLPPLLGRFWNRTRSCMS